MFVHSRGPPVPQTTARAPHLTLPAAKLLTMRLRMRTEALSSARSTTALPQ